jgi:predicted Zn-dependent protease
VKRKNRSGGNESSNNEKRIVLSINNDTKEGYGDRVNSILAEEQGEADFSIRILNTPGLPEEMKGEAISTLAAIQEEKKKRRLARTATDTNFVESQVASRLFTTPR